MFLTEHTKLQYNKLKRNRNVRAGAKAWEIKENSDEFTVTIKGNTFCFFSESDTPSFSGCISFPENQDKYEKCFNRADSYNTAHAPQFCF